MNIAVFHNFPPGGGKRTVYEQARGLLARNHRVTVFELSNPDSGFCDLKKLSCTVKVYPFSLDSHLPRPLARLSSDLRNFLLLPTIHRRIAAEINSGGFNVALIHPDIYTESPFILQFITIPHIYHCHELLRLGYEPELAFTDPVSWPKRLYELLTRKLRVFIDRQNARRASGIITSSRFVQSQIRSTYDRSSQVCYSGTDPAVFKPTSPKVRKILFMGQKNLIGGYQFVTQIMAQLQVTSRPVLQSFGFPGGRPDTHHDGLLAAAYSSALATLCVSYHEPFGLKALESMACGTPVLAVDEGGYRESVIHGCTGWLLPRDPKLFAAKIKYFLSHPQDSAKMGQTARRHILKHWTWDRHVNQLETILTHAAHSQRHQR